jgi:hypothetical protein
VYAEVSLALLLNATSAPFEASVIREMRDVWAYAHVVGAFGGGSVEQVVATEIAELSTELVLADMERVENRRSRIAKTTPARPGEEAALSRAMAQLEAERPLRLLEWESERPADVSPAQPAAAADGGQRRRGAGRRESPAAARRRHRLQPASCSGCGAVEAEITASSTGSAIRRLLLDGCEPPLRSHPPSMLNQTAFHGRSMRCAPEHPAWPTRVALPVPSTDRKGHPRRGTDTTCSPTRSEAKCGPRKRVEEGLRQGRGHHRGVST